MADKLEDALKAIKTLEARVKDLESKMAQKKDAKTVDQVQMKEAMKQVAKANQEVAKVMLDQRLHALKAELISYMK